MRNRTKRPVARRATAEQQVKQHPPSDALKTLSSAKSVLSTRHADLSWSSIAWELGLKDRGTLSRVARGKREPGAKLLAKLNSVYGCHLHLKTVRIEAPVCPVCDQPYEPRHKCEAKPTAPRRKYDMSNREAREIGIGILALLHTSPVRTVTG